MSKDDQLPAPRGGDGEWTTEPDAPEATRSSAAAHGWAPEAPEAPAGPCDDAWSHRPPDRGRRPPERATPPFAPHPGRPPAAPGEHSPAGRAPAGRLGATVLIVEHEESNRVLMEQILGLAGYRCVAVADGREALEIFDRQRPDIVLTDLALPVAQGYAVVAGMRARPGGIGTPIVAVTAQAMSGDRERALREGCTAYLAKPFRPRELVELVARLLEEAGG